ncbi:Hypothetical predicted protein [Paramuricea clavata]|uniref:Uncharacterized protein n=1 Tax=Paramuricea clavata TaxID=317549 RepID=A0A7D9JIR0_PARCT|nr:Hypothetical predicted protein [Paramuricea clavata]
MEHSEHRQRSFMDFRNQVILWISLIEKQLSEQLDHGSVSEVEETNPQSKDSQSKSDSNRSKISRHTKVSSRGKDSRRTTSVASSSSSAQLQEKARIAELMAEKLMLKRKQAIKAAEEVLKLDTEIAKARERVFEEIDEVKSQNSPESRKDSDMIVQPPATPHPVSTARHETIPLPTLSASSVTDSNRSIGRSHVLPQTITRRADFKYLSSTFDLCEKTSAVRRPIYNIPTLEPSSNKAWRDFISTQQQHNEHVIETNRRLAVAMTLPQPDVPKFTGDPLDYQAFIMAFIVRRIESKTHLAECLYYLNQYLNGEPKELISGCLYVDSIERYIEAKRLLDHEYGDPYKTSSAYINKVLSWPMLKYDDPVGLRRFSFFLKKCNNAMKSLSYMMALDHPSNMQIVVRKLPFALQNRWRDRVVDIRRTREQVATFKDLVNFVDSCAEAANDPIYGKAALSEKQSDQQKEDRRRQDVQKR